VAVLVEVEQVAVVVRVQMERLILVVAVVAVETLLVALAGRVSSSLNGDSNNGLFCRIK
jgi:hypothetical protein